MPRMCSVCSHADRDAIEDALSRGDSLRTVAARYSLSPPSLLRHRLHQQAPIAGGEESSEVEEPLADSKAGEETAHMTTKQGDPVAAARAEVARLHEAEHGMGEQLERVRADLATMRDQAGVAALEAHLAGSDPAAAVDGLATLLARESALTAGLAVARTGRIAAIRALWQAEAQQKRAEAAAVRERLASLKERTDALLAELQAVEETQHVPEVAWTASHGEYGNPTAADKGKPLSWRLEEQARTLERAAQGLEDRRDPPDAGLAGGSSVDDVIARTSDPLHVAPAPAAIRSWAVEAAAAAHIGGHERVIYHVEWRGGQLIPGQSSVRRA